MEIDRTAQATRTAPSNAAVFCVPSSTAWFVFGGGIVFLAFSFLGLALAFSKSSDRLSLGLGLAAAAGFGIFAVVAFRSFVRLRGKIAINEDGIWYLPHRGNGTSIQWKDISAVKADDTGQRLVLSDDLQRKTIRIEYQLKSFREIRDFVIAHTTAQIQRYASNLTVFHRTWINKIILAILGGPFLVVSWLSYRQGLVGLPLFVPLCLGMLSIISIVMDPLRVSIASDAVIVEYPGWSRTVLFDSIGKITIQDVQNRGNTWAAVVIERKKHRSIKLFRFREGSVALHEALQKAWEHAGGNQEPAA
jgi:hypothetical protein